MEIPDSLKKKREFLAPHSLAEYEIWKKGFDACYQLVAEENAQAKEILEKIKQAIAVYGNSKARTGLILDECVEKLKTNLP